MLGLLAWLRTDPEAVDYSVLLPWCRVIGLIDSKFSTLLITSRCICHVVLVSLSNVIRGSFTTVYYTHSMRVIDPSHSH